MKARCLFFSRQLGKNLTFRNTRLGDLAVRFAGIATEYGVPYLDLFSKLQADAHWLRAIALNDGLHPDGSGYEAIARHVAGWDTWRAEVG